MSRALALVTSDETHLQDSARIASPLLETKLYVPQPRADVVPRSRLVDALREGAARKLTIVVAPAGFGKSTLLASWLAHTAQGSNPAGWVSLDPSENDVLRFWTYFAVALEHVHPGLGAHALALLQSPKPPAIEGILTALINEIDSVRDDVTVVLDDYHVIDAAPVHASMTFLLDHMPRRMHLVIASRTEPPLALSRLRARGELTELRVADMRFTLDETSAFLNKAMSLGLSAKDTRALEQRTEGWIAGLKLAALSMKGRSDVRGFVDAFSGDNRHVADYLVEEVLHAEPEHVRSFLLATSILARMTGPLCDAVTGSRDSQAMLEELERRSLFVIALDDRREWFRYHHLFAETLQKQATARDAAAHRAAHLRASDWFEQHRSPAEAVHHALSAGDVGRAANLLERAWPENDRSYESRTWLERVKALPDGIVRARPVLSMAYAWALMNSGELEAAEQRLRDVERLLAPNDRNETSAPELVIADEERFRTLPSSLAAARVYLAQALGAAPATLEGARQALELAPDGDAQAQVTATALLALAHWGRGELEAAHRTFSQALDGMRNSGRLHDEIRGIFVLGDIRAAQGRLREAAAVYEHGLRYAKNATGVAAAETDELHIGLCETHREWNDIAAAAAYLETVARDSERASHIANRMRWCTAMASVELARGNTERAFELLAEGERHERRDPLPRARPISAMNARMRISQGRLDDAADWAKRAGVSVNDEPSYLHEFEHITLARLLIARHAASATHTSDDATRLLDRLAAAARTGGRIGSLIEILMLQSLLAQAMGNLRGALDLLSEALALAEPEGYMRVFLDEGVRMRDLLRHATARGLAGSYTRVVLSAFEKPASAPSPGTASPKDLATAGATHGGTHAGTHGVAQSLTSRELEILRLIAAGLRNQEIADHMTISAATVKRHIANAYGKLGVGHRTEALVRASELKLL